MWFLEQFIKKKKVVLRTIQNAPTHVKTPQFHNYKLIKNRIQLLDHIGPLIMNPKP